MLPNLNRQNQQQHPRPLEADSVVQPWVSLVAATQHLPMLRLLLLLLLALHLLLQGYPRAMLHLEPVVVHLLPRGYPPATAHLEPVVVLHLPLLPPLWMFPII